MNWNVILETVSTLTLFVPVIFILANRLYSNTAFLALFFYYLLPSIGNLINIGWLPAPLAFARVLAYTNNLLDAPLILYFLSIFTTTPKGKNLLLKGIGVFLVFEIVILVMYGFTRKSVGIILGLDTLVVLLVSFGFFLHNVRLAITHPKSLGKAVMISAVVLFYSIFSLIYLFFFILKTNTPDTHLVFSIITFASALTMGLGIGIEQKRMKKLETMKTMYRETGNQFGRQTSMDFQ